MRGLGLIGIVATAVLVSQNALALPMCPGAISGTHRPDANVPCASSITFSANSEPISSVLVQAMDIDFVTAVLRPQKHLIPFLRYYIPIRRVAPSHTISSGHSKRTLQDSAPLGPRGLLRSGSVPREESGDPKVFRSHDWRSNSSKKDSWTTRDHERSSSTRFGFVEASRNGLTDEGLSIHSPPENDLKARKVDERPPRQPPIHNPQ
ncbi:hypothetical protein RhiJN_07580 [Ceratobasidium sp. AG-Ba]|nr:hypothetical protein RhiJN_07580 [Ceratobasidium sp. AG-Ba]QRW08426.1 hypothetical protein RhiLY_07425 [Ceratobasidium sp. AG-Ba]